MLPPRMHGTVTYVAEAGSYTIEVCECDGLIILIDLNMQTVIDIVCCCVIQ